METQIKYPKQKIILFENTGKALPAQWSLKFEELKSEFKDIDTGEFDKKSYVEYLSSLFSRKIDEPKNKVIKLFFS